MTNQKCFLCKSSASKKSIVAAINGFKIYKCHQCNNAVTTPKLTIQNLKKLYTNKNYRSEDGKRFNPFFEKIFNIFKYLKYLRIKKYMKKKDSILDFGCGDGMLLYFFKKNGNKVKGTEFSISSNKLINGITVPVVNSKKIFNLKEKFNFIILSQVLPHLISPLILIKKLKPLLFKKGIIYISQPNIESVAFKFFKKNWFHLDIPRHLYHFDEINFIQFMEKNNLLLIKKKSIEIDHIFFGWIQSFMNIFLKRNLLFEYLTFYKKKLFFFDLAKIIILFFIFMPLSLILTLFETLNLIKPSITEYYFKKK